MGEVWGSGVCDSFISEAAEDVSVGSCEGGLSSCLEGIWICCSWWWYGVGIGQSSISSKEGWDEVKVGLDIPLEWKGKLFHKI